MKRRQDVDPQLHVLKSITNQIEEHKIRHQMESARFNVYAAFEEKDPARAKQWLRALSAAILALDGPARTLAEEAVAEIQEGLTDE